MSFQLPPEREYLTAAEAAAEKLPGFEFSERQIQRVLKDGHIATRPRSGRGGGREFHFTSLPIEAQTEYLRRHGRVSDELKTDSQPARQVEKNLRAQARAQIVDAVERLIIEKGNVAKALKTFSKLYAARKAGFAPLVYENQPTAAPDQVRTWRRAYRIKGMKGLIDRRGRKKKTRAFDQNLELRTWIMAQIFNNPQWSATKLCEDARRQLDQVIPARTMQAWVSEFRKSHDLVVEAMTNRDAARSHFKPAVGTRSHNIGINDLWELDATPGDCLCIVVGPDGEPMRDRKGNLVLDRQKITGVIDVGTRRAMCVVSKNPSGIATRALLRHMVLKYGVPKKIKSDNGKEFKNEAVMRFCNELGIMIEWCTPFSPEQKPHIERFFRTLNDDLFERLPGYIGHSVAERKGIEARKSWAHRFGEEARITFQVELTPEGLQARIDAWTRDVYHQRPHSSLGMSPEHKALAHASEVKFLEDPRVLDHLLLESAVRQVVKHGVRLNNRFYASSELWSVVTDQRFVRCLFDPLDPSWTAVYSHDGNEFICIAKDVDAMEPSERQRVAVTAQKVQRQVLGRITADARKVIAFQKKGCGIDDYLADARLANTPIAEIALEPMSAETHRIANRPTLLAHQKALEARDGMDTPEPPIEPTDAEREGAQRLLETAPERIVRMVDCSGYRRPGYEGEDEHLLILWWEDFEGNGGRLDDEDRSYRRELLARDDILTLLSIERIKRATGTTNVA